MDSFRVPVEQRIAAIVVVVSIRPNGQEVFNHGLKN